MTKNETRDVVTEAFLKGRKGRAGSFTSDGTKLRSYDAVIAERLADGTLVDRGGEWSGYSKTTNDHIRAMRRVFYRHDGRFI